LGVTLALLIALIAGGIGFAIGTNIAFPTDASGAVAVPPAAAGWHGWGWGFPFFPLAGLLLLVLFIAFFVGIARHAAWRDRGWYGPRGWGPGPWTGSDSGGNEDPRQALFDAWHRQAHGQGPAGEPNRDDRLTGRPSEGASRQGPQPQAPHPPGQPPYGQPPYGQPQAPTGDPDVRR
jgi:hypothetical protein